MKKILLILSVITFSVVYYFLHTPSLQLKNINGNYIGFDSSYKKYEAINFLSKTVLNYGFIDRDYTVIITDDYEDINKIVDKRNRDEYIPGEIIYDDNYVDGYFRFYGGSGIGFKNPSGEVIIEPIYTRATHFNALGYVAVCLTTNTCGVFNTEGEVVIELIYSQIELVEDRLSFKSTENLYGLLDVNGNTLLEPIYEDIGFLKEDLIKVKYSDKWSILDRDLNVVLDLKYDSIEDFSDGLYRVKDGEYTGVVDMNETVVIDFNYHEILQTNETSLYITKLNGLYGLIDIKGQIILEPQYNTIYIEEYFIKYSLNDQFGYINRSNLEIKHYPFDSINKIYYSNWFLQVEKDHTWYIVLSEGVEIPLDKPVATTVSRSFVRLGDAYLVSYEEEHQLFNREGQLLYTVKDFQSSMSTRTGSDLYFIKNDAVYRLDDNGEISTIIHNYSIKLPINQHRILTYFALDVLFIGCIIYFRKNKLKDFLGDKPEKLFKFE